MKNLSDFGGFVYSTNPESDNSLEAEDSGHTLDPEQQNLKVALEKKQRAGKPVTLISGYVGNPSDLDNLRKQLQVKCGVGGTVKDGDILIQGDQRDKVMKLLSEAGYKVKRIGG